MTNLITKILIQYHLYDKNALAIPNWLIQVLLIHTSLVNLSYIYFKSSNSWIYFLVVLARPQIYVKFYSALYFILGFLLLHIYYIAQPYQNGCQIVSLINQIIKGSVLNFILEQINNSVQRIIGIILLGFQFFEILCIQWTLNQKQKNFSIIQFNICSIINLIFNGFLIFFSNNNYDIQIIQIIGIANSIISVFNFSFFYFQHKFTVKLILAIHLITIFLGIIQFIEYQHSYTLIIIPLILKIVSFVKFNQNQNMNDTILIASIKLKKKQYYDCYKILRNNKEVNVLRQIKSQIILQQCAEQFSNYMSQINQFETLKGIADQLIQKDQTNLQIIQKLIKLVKSKITILENWGQNSLQYLNNYVYQMNITKQLINQQYNKYPFGQTQSFTVFFYAEIINDVIEANEKLFHSQKSLEGIFHHLKTNNKLYYVMAHFKNQQLFVTNVSSNAPSYLRTTNIDDLIPSGIKDCHNQLIDFFLQTGKSKFARTLNTNYIQKGNFLDIVNFAIDITYTNEINFISLFTPSNLQKRLILIINKNFIIKCYTQEVYEDQKFNQIFKKDKSILLLFPQLSNCNQSCILENQKYHQHQIMKTRLSFTSEACEEIQYFCDLLINVKKINDEILYYILEMQNLRTQYVTKNFGLSLATLTLFQNAIPEEMEQESILLPYQDIMNQNKDQNLTNNVFLTQRDEDIQLIQANITQEHDQEQNQSYLSDAQPVELYNNIDHINLEVISSVESLEQLRTSKYQKKYMLYHNALSHFPFKRHQQIILCFLILCLIEEILFIIIQISSFNFVGFASDIKLLEVKNLFFQPLDLFLLTRWTLWTYNYQKTHGIITASQYESISKFANSNLGEGYNSLDTNLQSVLFNQELQHMLQYQQLNIDQYTATYTYDIYNVTLRTAIQILMNFQYILKMNYVYEKTVSADSPQIFYSFKNYPTLRDIMTTLTNDIMASTIARGNLLQQSILIIFICQQVLILFSLFIAFFIKMFLNKKMTFIFHLASYPDSQAISNELERQNLLLWILQNDCYQLFHYQLKLFEKEVKYTIKTVDGFNKNYKTFKKRSIGTISFIIFIFIFYSIVSLIGFINYFQFNTYLNKYPATAKYKKQLSDLGGDIPLMFAQREVLYGRANYIYLDADYFSQIFVYVVESLNNTRQFSSADPDFSKMLMSQSFQDFYHQVQKSNLCDYLPVDIKERAETLCPIVLEQNMERGLTTLLIYITDLISTDMAINNFTYRATPTQNELEGAYMVSQVVNIINKAFYNDLQNLTTTLVDQQEYLNICYILLLTVILFLILIFFTPYFYNQTQRFYNFLQIIPSQTVYNNEGLERTVRILMKY